MSVTLTTQTIDGKSVVVGTDDATGDVSVAVDYSTLLNGIATSLETLSTNSTTIKNSTDSIASDLGSTEQHIHDIRDLGSETGSGIRVVSPYDQFSMIALYRYLILQGKLLDTSKYVSPAEQAQAAAKVPDLIQDIKNLAQSS